MLRRRQYLNTFQIAILFLAIKQGCSQIFTREHFYQSETRDLPWETRVLAGAPTNVNWCQYRDIPLRYNREVFRLQGSFGCYSFTNPSQFNPAVGRYPADSNVIDGLRYNVVLVNGTKHNVDYLDEESVELISQSLLSAEDVRKWKDCSRESEACCNYMLENPNTINGCPNTWDGWSCWPEAPINTRQHGICPPYVYSGSAPVCHHKSSKECFSNATWNASTDYSGCDITPRIEQRTLFHVAMLGTAVAFSLPAILIFCSYRKLRGSTSMCLVRNLLIAIVARNTLTIISKTTIILDAIKNSTETNNVMSENGAGCKILTVLEKLATNAVFGCMLILGIFLHNRLAKFSGELNMMVVYISVTVTCTVPVIVWTVVTAILNDQFCWTVDMAGYQWINDSVKIAMLAVNLILIIHIIWVLIIKKQSTKGLDIRTTKIAIFLLPVFGVQFIFTAARPNTTNCTGEQVFYFFSYALDGLQGAVVSTCFCYLNKTEVYPQLRQTYERVRMRVDRKYADRRANKSSPRNTRSTIVGNSPDHFSIGTGNETPNSAKNLSADDDPIRFYTPTNSLTGTPSSDNHLYYSPRSSLTGSSLDANTYYSPRSSLTGLSTDLLYYECIEDLNDATDSKIGTGGSPGGRDQRKPPQNVTVGFSPQVQRPTTKGYQNNGFSLSSENLPDDMKTVLRKRNPSLEFGSEETEV